MRPANSILLRLLGLLLLTAALLKGRRLLTEPVAGAVALLKDGLATSAWEEEAPDFETILETMTNPLETAAKHISASTNDKPHSL